jgi:hypothetical protein
MKPLSNTAFYGCGIGMRDAENAHPICGDRFAWVFTDERGLETFRRCASEQGSGAAHFA